jgi:hypothetical protein
MSATHVISETSLQFLVASGSPINLKNGFRTVSRSTISSYDSDDTIEIPDLLNSSQSLIFCGLQKEVAEDLYERWLKRQEDVRPGELGHGEDVIGYAIDYIKDRARVKNAFWESDDWDSALKHQGINHRVRNGILNPYYDNLRLSRSAAEWALDTLDEAWYYLAGLDARLKKRKMAVDMRSVSPDPSIKPSRALNPNTSLTASLHGNNPALRLATEVEVPESVSGRTILFKGGSLERLQSIFNSDGSLNLAQIVSTPPVDFHPHRYDLYFTKQYEVALHYANYVEERVGGPWPGIMTVAIPSSWLAESREVFGADWKNLIWSSRNRQALINNEGRLPTELSEYERADILIGNICATSNDQVAKLNSREDIQHLICRSGIKGTQIVFQGRDMNLKFRNECRGFVWVGRCNSKSASYFPPPL